MRTRISQPSTAVTPIPRFGAPPSVARCGLWRPLRWRMELRVPGPSRRRCASRAGRRVERTRPTPRTGNGRVVTGLLRISMGLLTGLLLELVLIACAKGTRLFEARPPRIQANGLPIRLEERNDSPRKFTGQKVHRLSMAFLTSWVHGLHTFRDGPSGGTSLNLLWPIREVSFGCKVCCSPFEINSCTLLSTRVARLPIAIQCLIRQAQAPGHEAHSSHIALAGLPTENTASYLVPLPINQCSRKRSHMQVMLAALACCVFR